MSNFIFEINTPLGFAVRCTDSYWDFISTEKHPVMRDKLDEVKQALSNPDEIRKSSKDQNVFLFYRGEHPRWIVAVAKKEDGFGFLITTYPADVIKVGGGSMEKIKFIHDEIGKTLTIWFGDPSKEVISEETPDEVVHMKDASGKIIGIEILNYDKKSQENYSFEHIRRAV